MTEIAVLTPAADDGAYAGHWPGVLERLAQALATADVTVAPRAWTDHIDDASGLAAFPLILPVLAWGYYERHPRWLEATRAWEATDLPLANPARVLGWNSDKTYLRRLEAAGIPIPATLWSEAVDQPQIDAAFDTLGAETLVVKPTVSGGAWKTTRMSRGEALRDAPPGDAMIQPFLPELVADGELSLLFFGGRFSHAVLKRAEAGDFRVQVQWGGDYVHIEPPAEALALAKAVLAAIEEPLLYARIDMVRAAGGQWLLMEAELIEPDFYLSEAPDGGRAFGEAVRARLFG